jgi:Fe-S-cluster-containing dehydrogenase component
MENRRQFIKNGLLLCLGAGGAVISQGCSTFPLSGGQTWAMIIDSSRCSGCQSCMVACKLQNNTAPEKFNTKIAEEEEGAYPEARISFTVSMCVHCNDAPCVSACPTKAVFMHESGPVLTDWNLCDGNGACIEACPYDARFHDPRFDGKTDKCDLCINRIVQGLNPACVENCPSGARMFGRLDKPEGEFARYLEKIPDGERQKRSVHIIASTTKGAAS